MQLRDGFLHRDLVNACNARFLVDTVGIAVLVLMLADRPVWLETPWILGHAPPVRTPTAAAHVRYASAHEAHEAHRKQHEWRGNGQGHRHLGVKRYRTLVQDGD